MFLFTAIVRLFQTRRGSDTAQKQKIKEAAGIIADVLVKHLEQKSFGETMWNSDVQDLLITCD